MHKLNRVLVVLLVVQAATFITIKVMHNEEPLAKNEVRLFKGLSIDDFVGIEVQSPKKGKVVLKREGKKWFLVSHANYPGDGPRIGDIIGKLPNIKAAIVAETASYHYAFEVSDKRFKRRVTLKTKGGKAFEFVLGTSPGTKKVHLRFKGEQRVYAVMGLSTWDFADAASGWLNLNYWYVDLNRLVNVKVENEHGVIELARGLKERNWRLVGSQKPAAQQKADDWAKAVTDIPLVEPVSKGVKPEYGFDKPMATITVKTQAKATTAAEGDGGVGEAVATSTRRMLIGAKAKDSGNYYAKMDDSDFVVMVGPWKADKAVQRKLADIEGKGDGLDHVRGIKGNGQSGVIPLTPDNIRNLDKIVQQRIKQGQKPPPKQAPKP